MSTPTLPNSGTIVVTVAAPLLTALTVNGAPEESPSTMFEISNGVVPAPIELNVNRVRTKLSACMASNVEARSSETANWFTTPKIGSFVNPVTLPPIGPS